MDKQKVIEFVVALHKLSQSEIGQDIEDELSNSLIDFLGELVDSFYPFYFDEEFPKEKLQ